MRRLVLTFASVFLVVLVGNSQFVKKIDVTQEHLLRMTPVVRDLPDMQAPLPATFRKLMSEKNTEDDQVMKIYSHHEKPDPVLQRRINNLNGPSGANGGLGMNESTVNKIWDGMTAPGVSPTDPCMAAGPNHILQMVNGNVGNQIGGFFRVWDKSGNALTSNIFVQTLSGLP